MDRGAKGILRDVEAAGGSLTVETGDLAARLELAQFDPADVYSQHVVVSRLAEVGVTVRFEGSTVDLTAPSATTPAPDPAPAPTPVAEPAAPPVPAPAGAAGQPSPGLAGRIWNSAYLVMVLITNLFPSVAFQLAPGGELEGKTLTFFSIYLQTLPFSIAVSAIVLIIYSPDLNEQEKFFWSCGAMVVSGVIGLGLGASLVDQEFLSQVRGNVLWVVAQIALYVMFGYAFVYGGMLFVAGIVAGIVGGVWVQEKVGS